MGRHDLKLAAEGNIRVLTCQSECGQGLSQVLLVPFGNVFIPPQVEAFPLAQVLYFNKEYICLRFDIGSCDIIEQRSFPNLGVAIGWGRAHARAWLVDLMGQREGPKRSRRAAVVASGAGSRAN